MNVSFIQISPHPFHFITLHFTKCFHKSFHWVFKPPPTKSRAWISRWENAKIRKKKWFSQGNSPIFILCFICWGLSLIAESKFWLETRKPHLAVPVFSPVSPREHAFQNSASASSSLCTLLKFCASHLDRMLRCPWHLAGTQRPDLAEGRRAWSISTLWNDSSPQQMGFESQNSNVLWNCWLAMNDPKWVVQEGLGKQLFLAVHSESFLKDYDVEPRSMPLLVWLWMVLCP